MQYKRILLKLSGQMLGQRGEGFSAGTAAATAAAFKEVLNAGIQLAVLVGGGNILRAREVTDIGRLRADFMGMHGTIINALGLSSVLAEVGIESEIFSALGASPMLNAHDIKKEKENLAAGKVVIFAGGTGSPFFSTDTAAVLRALEIKAGLMLKATKVDGVYTSDPEHDSEADFIPQISYMDAIAQELAFMDTAAMVLASENSLPTVIFNFHKKGNLIKVLEGDRQIGTYIS